MPSKCGDVCRKTLAQGCKKEDVVVVEEEKEEKVSRVSFCILRVDADVSAYNRSLNLLLKLPSTPSSPRLIKSNPFPTRTKKTGRRDQTI